MNEELKPDLPPKIKQLLGEGMIKEAFDIFEVYITFDHPLYNELIHLKHNHTQIEKDVDILDQKEKGIAHGKILRQFLKLIDDFNNGNYSQIKDENKNIFSKFLTYFNSDNQDKKTVFQSHTGSGDNVAGSKIG